MKTRNGMSLRIYAIDGRLPHTNPMARFTSMEDGYRSNGCVQGTSMRTWRSMSLTSRAWQIQNRMAAISRLE